MKPKFASFILIFAAATTVAAAPRTVVLSQWLALGPVEFSGAEKTLLKTAADCLAYDSLPVAVLQPRIGERVRWNSRQTVAWAAAATVPLTAAAMQVQYLATYLETSRWLKAELVVQTDSPLAIHLDGAKLDARSETGKVSATLKLENGRRHLLLLKRVIGPEKTAHPPFRAVLEVAEPFADSSIDSHAEPGPVVGLEQVLNIVNVTGLAISPDGRRAAVFLSRQYVDEKAPRKWGEIIDLSTGRTIFRLDEGGDSDRFAWLSDGDHFLVPRTENELTALDVFNLADYSRQTILKGIKDFAGCWWSSSQAYLIYATAEAEPAADKGYKFVEKLADRFQPARLRRALTLFIPESGSRHPIGGPDDDFEDVHISPNGKKALLLRTVEDTRQRPYQKTAAYLFDFQDFSLQKAFEGSWLTAFSWSPDSSRILCLGGPSAFGGAGKNVAAGLVPNENEGEAYIYDPATRQAEAISRNFDPSIVEAFWHGPDNAIYLKVVEESFTRLFRYNPRARSFTRLKAPVEQVAVAAFPAAGPFALYWGSSVQTPPRLFRLNLASGESGLLRDFNTAAFAGIHFGREEEWNFAVAKGKVISGTLYFPPDFDPGRKSPCIVYYYGGTEPALRAYGGRYPKAWYAANGYVVYVLHPSGTYGFGQNFAAEHVNDWGETTAEEIIAAVKGLLRTHPFVDPGRVGAMGASYGGFLTQYLAAKTDLFAAYVSHAGISSITSYWGVGEWGVEYSASASADSFPWNRKDIYVGHSPLYMAERISKPLLLLHGEADNNVPPGESYQMFAALKLLGKEVALVTFPGQQHTIQDYRQRQQWQGTIMAWFDRWLKGQGGWWNDLYPPAEPRETGKR